jgi:glucuronoarabinoxylan endo-1,4-beta-xylanase
MHPCPKPTLVLPSLLLCATFVATACDKADDPVNVSVTVHTNLSHQTLAGFGAAVAYQPSLLAGRNDDIYRVLFVDSGLDILRLGNWYQNQTATNTTTTTPFSDSAQVQIVQKALAARAGVPLKILMSSWTPPAYLKSNGMTRPPWGASSTGDNVGTLAKKDGAYAYGDFADWWVRSLEAYAAQGVVPDYISIQNEPDFFTMGWETCVWGRNEGEQVEGVAAAGYPQALEAVYNAVASSGLATKPIIVGPETTGFANFIVPRYLAAVKPGLIGAIAHHLYGTTEDNPNPDWFNGELASLGKAAAPTGLPTFMTEYSPNKPTMFETAWLMNNALTVEGVSAYIYWELIWNGGNPPTGLVTVSNPFGNAGGGYTINDIYYAFKHFARWTDPGWTRVEANTSASEVRVSAFVSPDGGSLTLVLLNTGNKDRLIAVNPGDFAFGTFAAYRSSGDTERTTAVSLESDGTLALPSRSIATVTFTP